MDEVCSNVNNKLTIKLFRLNQKYSNLITKIFNDNELKGKEKLAVILLKEKDDYIVGKSISLQMITLCCVNILDDMFFD